MHFRALVAGYAALAYQLIFYFMASLGGLTEGLAVAITLTSSVLIAGIGSLSARRLFQSPRLPESLLGLYCLVLFSILYLSPSHSLTAFLSWLPQPWNALPYLVITAIPYFLAGSLLPLYARELGSHNRFGSTYFWFHAGAAVAMLALEFFVISNIGWLLSGVTLAVVSLFNGISLRKPVVTSEFDSTSKASFFTEPRPQSYQLLFVSILTGYAGILFYSTFNTLVGAWIHNYAVATAFIFLGLAISGVLAKTRPFSNDFAILAAIAGIIVMVLAALGLSTYPAAASFSNLYVYYFLFAAIFTIPTFVLIGLYLPVFVHNGYAPDQALFWASLGNFFGYWIYTLSANQNLSLIILFALLLPSIARANSTGLLRLSKYGALAYGLLAISLLPTTDIRHAVADYRYTAKPNIKSSELIQSWNTYGWNNDVHRLQMQSNKPPLTILSIAGYTSLNLDIAAKNETLAGLIPASFAKNFDNALVLGSGTGITAGAIGTQFNSLHLVDLSPDLQSQLDYYSTLNHHLLENPGLETFSGDAQAFVASTKQTYDLIFSTVSGAGYAFSAGLYTQSFFENAKSRLAPGGVFGTWIDTRFTAAGGALILKAMKDTFAHTRIFAIHPPQRGGVTYQPGYIILLGSNEEISYNPSKRPMLPAGDFIADREAAWCDQDLLTRSPANTPFTLAASYNYNPGLYYELDTPRQMLPVAYSGKCWERYGLLSD